VREADFVSLAEMLIRSVPPAVAPEEVPVPVAAPEARADDGATFERSAALREARLFRARLADALDAAAVRLLRDVAADVVARELQLAPCDVARIVERVQRSAPVVAVRVAAADAAQVTQLPVVIDDALQPGDAVLEVAGGTVDARLGVRLAHVLEAFA
jgi:flagellar biosynthesis/type III secretory pathway protein FliH